MHQEPEMIYGKRQRETMTSYAPPMRRRVDSDKRSSLGWWGVIGDLVGFTLMELISPVAGLAVFIVTFCVAALGVGCDLIGYGMRALNRMTRNTKA